MSKSKVIRHKTRLKRGDTVQVIAGKDRGQVGKIIDVDLKKAFFRIEGINIQKKHMKPNNKNQRGGIIAIEGPVHFSNVLLFDKATNKGSRIRIEIKNDIKNRVFVKSKAK